MPWRLHSAGLATNATSTICNMFLQMNNVICTLRGVASPDCLCVGESSAYAIAM